MPSPEAIFMRSLRIFVFFSCLVTGVFLFPFTSGYHFLHPVTAIAMSILLGAVIATGLGHAAYSAYMAQKQLGFLPYEQCLELYKRYRGMKLPELYEIKVKDGILLALGVWGVVASVAGIFQIIKSVGAMRSKSFFIEGAMSTDLSPAEMTLARSALCCCVLLLNIKVRRAMLALCLSGILFFIGLFLPENYLFAHHPIMFGAFLYGFVVGAIGAIEAL